MVYQNFCNGCKKKSLIKVNSNGLQICKNCLLVSKKIDQKFVKSLKKSFSFNIDYSFSPLNYKARSKKNFFFLRNYLKSQILVEKMKFLILGQVMDLYWKF